MYTNVMKCVKLFALQSMCRGLPWLESLDLSDCDGLSSLALQSLAYHCHYLRSLHLSNCYNVRLTLCAGLWFEDLCMIFVAYNCNVLFA